MAVITIIGIGQMGSALAFVAAENGNTLRLVGTPVDREVVDACRQAGRHPKLEQPFPAGTSYYYCEQWQEAVRGCDFVIGAVSSFGVEWFLNDILMKMDPSVPVLSAAKGLTDLEDGTLISYPEYWERALAKAGIKREIYALGGPGTAGEIMAHDHTQVAICGQDPTILRMMKSALQTWWFHISLTHDANGLESAVAIKNAYALGVAMALGYARRRDGDEEKSHYNSQAAVFYQAAKEMIRVLQIQKADFDSALVGIGDLYVTVTGARTRKIGLLLGEGKTYEEAQKILGGITLESIVVVRRLAKAMAIKAERGEVNLDEFPLLAYVMDVLESGRAKDLPWDRFTFENI
ncbi:MAG: glycerol-3-phosphate dehydrogenase [Bacteroidales bacterium]|nr:glycerol-3-phosphate dehydrogenase [Bacteroidales bacterium]